jgi:hypothetical protein
VSTCLYERGQLNNTDLGMGFLPQLAPRSGKAVACPVRHHPLATASQANSPVAVPGTTAASPSTSIGAATPSAPAMSIGSIITPTNLRGFSQPDQNWPDQFHSHFVTQPRSSYPPELVYGPPADDSPFYSSDSCYSPSSETPYTQPYLPPYDNPTLASLSHQP